MVELYHLSSFIIFSFFSIKLHHGQGSWSFFKNNWSKLSTPTLKKPVLSSSASHTSYASNSTGTTISSQLDNDNIIKNQNKNNTSNTDDIHSGVTPQKQNYSVQATSTNNHLTSLNATLPIVPVELHATKNYPLPVENICVFRLTKNYLMRPSVSNHG